MKGLYYSFHCDCSPYNNDHISVETWMFIKAVFFLEEYISFSTEDLI